MVVTAARNPLAEMGFEDDYAYQTGSYGSSTSHLDVTRYGLGTRGGTGCTHGTPPLVPPTLWLARAKFIKLGQSILKIVGYSMIIKAFLMDIDFGDDRSGLDIILGGA